MTTDAPVLIFGATGGVGEALTRRLAAEGRAVHLAGRDQERVAKLAEEVGGRWSRCDVLDDADLSATVADAGPVLAGLVFAVGSIDLGAIARQERADYRISFELNAVSAAQACRAALCALKAGRGAVVLFSTIAASQGFQNHAVISAAKGAVEGLTRAMAAEFAPDVRVNAIAPSLMRTPLSRPVLVNPKMEEALAAQHPIPRLGEAADATGLAAFLLSQDAAWITGQVLHLDGGRSTVRVKG